MAPAKKRIYLSPPDMSPQDRALLLDAFDSNWVAPLGPHVDAFEAEFAATVGVPHAVAVASGTAALHLALVAAGVQPGDYVLTSTLTFVATANAIRHAGAVPVFVDSCPQTWNLSPALLDDAAHALIAQGKRVSAVAPVDLFGQPADYDAIRDVCSRHGLALVADAAESLGSAYREKSSAAVADFGCYSFNGNKIITTSGGGMVTAHREEDANRVRLLASQARLPGVEYHHSETGYNYRLSNLLAAVGRGQLADLDRRVQRRRSIFQTYQAAFESVDGVRFMPAASNCRSNRWLTCIQIDQAQTGCGPNQVRLALEAENIESRPVWKPMHRQPAYQTALLHRDAAPVADRLWREGLCLPSGSSMSDQDVNRVIKTVRLALSKGLQHRAA